MRWCNYACKTAAAAHSARLVTRPLRVATRSARLVGCCAALLVGSGGCISASLATSTGIAPAGTIWSNQPVQSAHVGEMVKFDFVLTNGFGRPIDPVGIADYVAAYFGNERIEVEPLPAGYFRFEHKVDAPAGTEIDVDCTAYRQRAERDFVKVGNEWMATSSPYAEPDRKMAHDSVKLEVYQSHVRFRIPRPADDLDPSSGVMHIVRNDGHVTTVYIDRPHRPGFKIAGPGADGYYDVTFDPDGDMVNHTGTTRVEFRIHDLSGHRHDFVQQMATP